VYHDKKGNVTEDIMKSSITKTETLHGVKDSHVPIEQRGWVQEFEGRSAWYKAKALADKLNAEDREAVARDPADMLRKPSE
jgi:hypothetical protein